MAIEENVTDFKEENPFFHSERWFLFFTLT